MGRTKRGTIVLLGLFLLVLSSFALAEIDPGEQGCYINVDAPPRYCNFIQWQDALQDCVDCTPEELEAHEDLFWSGESCNQFPECEQVVCDVLCNEDTPVALGLCEHLGVERATGLVANPENFKGEKVPDGQFDVMCGPRCCKAGNNQCSITQSSWECELYAKQRSPFDPVERFDFRTDAQCDTFCRQPPGDQTGSIHVTVTDGNVPVPNVNIQLVPGEEVTVDGEHTFEDVVAGRYTIVVTADGFTPASQRIDILPNQVNEVPFALLQQQGMSLTLTITGRDNVAVDAVVTVSLAGRPTVHQSESGVITLPMTPGIHTITVHNELYTSQQFTETFVADDENPHRQRQIQLVPLEIQPQRGVTGHVSMQLQGGENPIPALASIILVDGRAVRGGSTHASTPDHPRDGWYQFELPPGTYTLSAIRTIGEPFRSQEVEVTVGENGFTPVEDLVLRRDLPACNGELRPPVNFKGAPVKGKEQIKLTWERPCPALQVYRLIRFQDGIEIGRENIPFHKEVTIDTEVAWGMSYSYTLEAGYGVDDIVFSEPVPVNPELINVGDETCDGKYHDGWDQFCNLDPEHRNIVYTCNDLNTVEEVRTCGQDQFCAPQGAHDAVCKVAQCSAADLGAGPFGLYHTAETCYNFAAAEGSEPQPTNYCYYDYTPTVVDSCLSCATVQSCFQYQSQSACEQNNCLTSACSWVEGGAELNLYAGFEDFLSLPDLQLPTTAETGHGYCVDVEASGADNCGLCGPGGSLFENTFCTGEVCAALGSCMANPSLTKCESCENKEPNCYAYQSEVECVGGAEFSVLPQGSLQFSEDSCGWGRCRWVADTCVKDGDYNDVSDCAGGDDGACVTDITAPTTRITSDDRLITLADSTISFTGEDESGLGSLYYCVRAPGTAACNPLELAEYESVEYGGLVMKELTVDLLSFVEDVDGDEVELVYFSVDTHSNREQLRLDTLFIDTINPSFVIRNSTLPVGDNPTRLDVWLEEMNEPMECDFTLHEIIPARGEVAAEARTMDQELRVSFEISGSIYDVIVTCRDVHQNEHRETIRTLVDRESRIIVHQPASAVASSQVDMEIETTVPATCALQAVPGGVALPADNLVFERNAEFTTHRIQNLGPFVQGQYFYQILCSEVFFDPAVGPEDFTDVISFEVDFTGPESTQIIVQEGARVARPHGDEWDVSFVESAVVSFECAADGIGCGSTLFCLDAVEPAERHGCDAKNNPDYQELDLGSTIELSETVRICYFSRDEAGNEESFVTCGIVRFDGYGVRLVQPPSHYVHTNEGIQLWGVSDETPFDVAFHTIVPTTECRHSFSPIESDAQYQTLSALQPDPVTGLYTIQSFPEGFAGYPESGGVKKLYIQCMTIDGERNPAPGHAINLEFEPGQPSITDIQLDPNPTLQGPTTLLTVDTDQYTLCRYSDDETVVVYDQMPYTFPGNEPGRDIPILARTHQDEYSHQGSGEYTLNVLCVNGAGNVSELQQTQLTVDLSAVGEIVSVAPSGYFRQRAVDLQVTTNKDARCTFQHNGTVTEFSQTGGVQHTHSLSDLEDDEYVIMASCTMTESGFVAEQAITFTIDHVAPTVTEITVPNRTCSLTELSVYIYTDEVSATADMTYYYELHKSGFSSRKIANGTVAGNQPVTIRDLNFTADTRYIIKARAADGAGNWGNVLVSSDSFLAVPDNDSVCQADSDPPRIFTHRDDSICTGVGLQLRCDDSVGCGDIRYGRHSNKDLCVPTQGYSGSSLLIGSSEWLCYVAEDTAGNPVGDTEYVEIHDADGDGIVDNCDVCANTPAGKFVDGNGCASGDVPGGIDAANQPDSDTDGLPDYWENIYDSPTCPLDANAADSDDNGVPDNMEDYDGDGFTNYQELTSGTNPCSAADHDLDPVPSGPSSPSEEESSIAWILFWIGLIMFLGGTGYLIYYYNNKPQKTAPQTMYEPVTAPVKRQTPQKWEKPVRTARGSHRKERKRRTRKGVFSAFTPSSSKIPHVEPIIQKHVATESSPHRKIQDIGKTYVKHKDAIKPGLKKAEQNIFDRLEKIVTHAKKKKKPVKDVVGKKEAHDIFEKLRRITAKRKSKK